MAVFYEFLPKLGSMMTLSSFLDVTSYFQFLDGLVIALFIVTLLIIFIYQYDVLRRKKS
jgi:hypothetical protein